MARFVSIDIPTKPYIKAYIINKLGEWPIMHTDTKGDPISRKLYDLLEHSTNEYRKVYAHILYTTVIRIRLPLHTFRQRGHCLNETNIKNFNLFVEDLVKHNFYILMDDYMDVLPSFVNNLPTVRKKLGITDADIWSDESMQKDYYRYRKKSGKKVKTRSKHLPKMS
jgi:hypothetical protein